MITLKHSASPASISFTISNDSIQTILTELFNLGSLSDLGHVELSRIKVMNSQEYWGISSNFIKVHYREEIVQSK